MTTNVIDFIHIGKCGGNFVSYVLNKANITNINYLSHEKSILNEKSNKVFFFIRDPLDRFISGFISRFRKGRPKNNCEWSKGEKDTFEYFKTPNDIAEALTSQDLNIKQKALDGMNNISMCKWDILYHLKNISNIKKYKNKIIHIGKLETIENDLQIILKKLGSDFSMNQIKYDNLDTHSTPDEYLHLKKISSLGKKNIIEYYKKDYEIIEYLISENMIDSNYYKFLNININ